MHLKRLAWLALLLPQFALLLFAAYDDLRELRHEIEFHFPRMMTICLPWPEFSGWIFSGELVGVAAVIGLCASRPWARLLYAGFAVWLLANVVEELVNRPGADQSILIIFAPIAATLALSFRRPLNLRPAT